MTQSTISYLTGLGAIACFIIPAYQLIIHTDKKGFKNVTPIGWIMFLISAYLYVIIILSDRVNAAEKAEADRIRKADQEMYQNEVKRLKDTLTTTRDTLIKIGIKIDEKTGRLLVIDSLLLKKLLAITPTKSISESFIKLKSPSFMLAHLPIAGTENFYVNGVFVSKNSWNRVGRKVTFMNLGYQIDSTDLISASYSYFD